MTHDVGAEDAVPTARSVLSALNTKRRWGYWVWLIGAAVILIPELTAAFSSGALPFTTISATVGHLERRSSLVELPLVALLVWVAYSTVRVPPRTRSGVEWVQGDVAPARTPGGRLTRQGVPQRVPHGRALDGRSPVDRYDSDDAPGWFWAAVVGVLALISVVGLGVSSWWPDTNPGSHYHVGYVLYGMLACICIVAPSVAAFGWSIDAPFPTFFRAVTNFEDWLSSRGWRHSLGPSLAWFASYLILFGLVLLLLHLTLYPFPNITKILNPHG